jgi:hypothetical protein
MVPGARHGPNVCPFTSGGWPPELRVRREPSVEVRRGQAPAGKPNYPNGGGITRR